MRIIKELNDEELMKEYANAVRFDHYDPHGMPAPQYNADDLMDEIMGRMEAQYT